MNAFSLDELTRMQAAQEGHMMDTCVWMAYSSAQDEINHPAPTWTDTVTLPCGLDMTGGLEDIGSQRVIVRYDAVIRLPLDTTFDLRDRMRVTKRFGQTLATPLVYEIAAPEERGPSGLVFRLRKVDPGV